MILTTALEVGVIDVADFVDVYAMMNPLTHFVNLGLSTNPTIGVPNQGLGAVAAAMLTDRLYIQGGFGDANGQPTLAGFDTFFGDSEYFSYVEVGATSSQDRIYLDNIHVRLWHTDARQAAGTPEGWGVAFTAQKFVSDKWLPFFRFGYADGDAALRCSGPFRPWRRMPFSGPQPRLTPATEIRSDWIPELREPTRLTLLNNGPGWFRRPRLFFFSRRITMTCQPFSF